MTVRAPFALFAVALLATGVGAQPPAPKATPDTATDQIAIDVLKAMHNLGAERYNADDAAGCLKIYRTALLTVKPFLKHRSAVQATIDSGVAEADKAEGAKRQAFRMHELIERVRADLKPDTEAPEAKPATLSGRIALDGKPLAGAAITIAGGTRAFTAVSDSQGRFDVSDAIPAGAYAVFVTGEGVPAVFHTAATSGVALEIAAGKNSRDLELKSK